MKRFFNFFTILFLISGFFFYLGFEPEPYEIDMSGTFLGYNFQTSQYTVYAILIALVSCILIMLKFFFSIKSVYNYIVYFFTGRNKNNATDNLLNAYAYIVSQSPKSAQIYLKKSESYFKESPHVALIKLLIEHSQKVARPSSQFIALIEKNKFLNATGSYIESLFPANYQDKKREIQLLKDAGNYTQSLSVFYQYLTLLIQEKNLNDAEKALKSARSLLTDTEYKFHLSFLLLLKSNEAFSNKDVDQMLSLALASLKYYQNPIALQNVIHAYRTLQRDNKASRLLADYFMQEPTMNVVRLFLEFKGIETPEATAKRISALPRTFQTSEAFVALQSYHFAIARDFISLNTIIQNCPYQESLWFKGAQICIAVEKDALLLTEALILFKETFYAQCHQEIIDIVKDNKLGLVYYDTLSNQEYFPNITIKEVSAMITLFKRLLKTIPILQFKNMNPSATHFSLQENELYRIEGNVHKKI